MGQGGRAGTTGEFENDLFSFRWTASGGSSSSRWRSAVPNAEEMGDVYKRWTFVCMDAFELLLTYYNAVKAEGKGKECGIYCDPPFHKVADPYRYRFTIELQKRLADSVARLPDTRRDAVSGVHAGATALPAVAVEHHRTAELHPGQHCAY